MPGHSLGLFCTQGVSPDADLTLLRYMQAVVIGGGYIGLEMTAALRSNGLDVTCVLPQEHFLAKMLTDELGEIYESYYKEKGVNIRAKARAVSFEPKSPGSKQVTSLPHQDWNSCGMR